MRFFHAIEFEFIFNTKEDMIQLWLFNFYSVSQTCKPKLEPTITILG